MRTCQVRLTDSQVEWIDRQVRKGRFVSRNDGVRYAVRLLLEGKWQIKARR